MNGIRTVAGKELARVFGDKKLVFSLFIMPAVLMFVLYSIMGKAMSGMMHDIDQHTPYVYVENAPEDFIQFLEMTGFEADINYYDTGVEDVETLKEKIKSGDVDLIVMFPENFTEAVNGYEEGTGIPEVKTYHNPLQDYSAEARNKFVNGALASYKEVLLQQRIGDLDSLVMFQVDLDENASIVMDESKAGSKMLAMMLPYLIVMLLFTGPMSLGVDAITGEKERGTMATMLVAPIKRSEIVIGKILSLSLLSCMSAVVYTVSIIISVPRMYSGMDESGFEGTASFTLMQILQLLIIMLVLVCFYVGIVSLISVFAKTVKEAGTYVSPVYIIVVVAGVLTMFGGNTEMALPLFAIPVYGSAAAIQRVITGDLTAVQFGTSLVGLVVLSIILMGLITKAFKSEKVMFNA